VADTNNHRILFADIETKQVSEFVVEGLKPPAPPKRGEASSIAADEAIEVKSQSLKAGSEIPVIVDVTLPEEFKLNPLAPVVYRLGVEGEQSLIAADILGPREEATVTKQGQVKFSVPLQKNSGKATLLVTLNYNYCRDGKSGVCKIGSATWKIPVELGAEGSSELKLSVTEE
jgi:hypothetical protein